MTYLIRDPDSNPTNLAVDGTITQASTTAQQITNEGIYLITATVRTFFAIANATIGVVNATNGITVSNNNSLYIYIESGQYINFSADTATYVKMKIK